MCCSRNNLHGRLGIAHIKKWFDSAQPAGSSRAFYNMFPGRLVLSVADRSAHQVMWSIMTGGGVSNAVLYLVSTFLSRYLVCMSTIATVLGTW